MTLSPSLRTACYDEKTGHLAVKLVKDDHAFVVASGVGRYTENRKGDNPDGAYRTGLKERLDVEGIYGELPLALVGGVMPAMSELVKPYREWASLSAGGKLTDFRGAEIRTAITWPSDDRGPLGLFLHKDTRRDKDKDPKTICILAIVTNLTPFENDKFQYGSLVVYPGWCHLEDVREDHFFTKCVEPEYRVPQHELRPMGELADRLFILPKTVRELRAEREEREEQAEREQRREREEREQQAADEVFATWSPAP